MADRKKRRSLMLFSTRQSTSDDGSALSQSPSPVEQRGFETFDTPQSNESSNPRPRIITKSHRHSVFGSLRSLHSLEEDEKKLVAMESRTSSFHGDAESPGRTLFGDVVKKAAEVQVTGTSVFRKRTQYIVLTESHLIRFKSQAKAAEMYPVLSAGGKISSPRVTSTPANPFHDMQSSTYLDITQGVPLEEVVAIHRLEDGRPYFTLEVAYLTDHGTRSSSIQLNLAGPREADAWMQAVREHADARRAISRPGHSQRTLSYLSRMLAKEKDYDPLHFHAFTVVQRTPIRPAGSRVSPDDLSKNVSSLCYIVIGLNKVHFVPLPKSSGRSSSISLHELDVPSSFGIVNLTSVKLRTSDDSFELYFRTPVKHPFIACLASHESESIALWLRYAFENVCPEWLVQPFVFDVPSGVEDRMNPPKRQEEDNNGFDKTLIAFCAAFELDPSKIYYSVDYDCEDAPCFRLLPTDSSGGYSMFELLAILRALRYNESFGSVCFAGINLGPLRTVYDPYGASDDSMCGRDGKILELAGHGDLSVLQQELRAIALKSRKLRRFDFTDTLPHLTKSGLSSGIPEALTPLCKKTLTNVDWITLNGIRLTEHDIDYLVDAASERRCHLRALEVGRCGLSVHDVDVILCTLGVHDNTMEVIDISGTQGRFSPELFQRAIGAFSRIRRLNLSRIQKTAGPEPLIAPEVLLSWRLESLYLDGSTLNEQSVDTVAAYLASPKSNLLRELSLSQCGMTGRDLAIFFQSMTRQKGRARQMHVSASENRLGRESSLLCRCIAQNYGPTSITMRMIDFEKEYQFRELVTALTINTTIKSLDISQASLPYDASMETCESLKELFARNQTLEELDISGDVAHLDMARFGIGLNIALPGLEQNRALRLLRIEHQNLGLQGANTLAGVIEKNSCLAEIYCEHNDINLQSFTVLVNALKKNKTLLYMPAQDHDRARSMEKLKEEFESVEKNDTSKSPRAGTFKKGFQAVAAASRHKRQSSAVSSASVHSFSQQNINDMIAAMQEKWATQAARLQQYLLRNYQLASGMSWEELDRAHRNSRPATADSIAQMLAKINFDVPQQYDPVDVMNEKAVGGRQERAAIFTLPDD